MWLIIKALPKKSLNDCQNKRGNFPSLLHIHVKKKLYLKICNKTNRKIPDQKI